MPRPRCELSRARDAIQGLWETGISIPQLLHIVNFEVLPEYDIGPTSLATLKRYLQEWGLQRQIKQKPQVSDELLWLIKVYFFKYGYSDRSIIRDLEKDGFHLTPYGLQVIRWENGMKRRYRDISERDEAL